MAYQGMCLWLRTVHVYVYLCLRSVAHFLKELSTYLANYRVSVIKALLFTSNARLHETRCVDFYNIHLHKHKVSRSKGKICPFGDDKTRNVKRSRLMSLVLVCTVAVQENHIQRAKQQSIYLMICIWKVFLLHHKYCVNLFL